jgi:hypothetical protein
VAAVVAVVVAAVAAVVIAGNSSIDSVKQRGLETVRAVSFRRGRERDVSSASRDRLLPSQ